MLPDDRWAEVKAALPVGAIVSGTIAEHHAFGVVLQSDERPDAIVVLDAVAYRATGARPDSPDWLRVGARIRVRVIAHSEWGRQVKVEGPVDD